MAPVLVIALGAGIYAALHWAKPEPEKKEDPVRPLSVFIEPVEQKNILLTVETAETFVRELKSLSSHRSPVGLSRSQLNLPKAVSFPLA